MKNKYVSVQLFSNGLSITPSDQGYLGKFNAPDEIEMKMILTQPECGKVILITTDRNRENVSLLVPGSDGIFSHTVPVIQPEPGLKFDRDDANRNCVHLIEMNTTGLVSVTNIVVTAQDGEFFLIFHPTYVAQAFNAGGRVGMPSLQIEPGFPCLIPLVAENYSKVVTSLPPLSSWKDEDVTKPEILAIANGLPDEDHLVVKFWSVRTGTGGALGRHANGQLELVKLYWKNINVADRCPAYLLEGETVVAQSFRRLHKGRMRFEAIGITREEFQAAAV